jgi:hypothetical protein
MTCIYIYIQKNHVFARELIMQLHDHIMLNISLSPSLKCIKVQTYNEV